MDKISLLARVLSGIISFAYMLLLTPHVGSIGSDANLNANPLYVTAWVVAIIWVPLVVVHINRKRLRSRILNTVSLGSLALEVAFFSSLFLNA